MKYLLIASMIISGSAFAYNSHTMGNGPVKEEVPKAASAEKRDPASVSVKASKPSEKMTPKK